MRHLLVEFIFVGTCSAEEKGEWVEAWIEKKSWVPGKESDEAEQEGGAGKGYVIYTSTVERLEETTANIFNHYDNNF